MNKKHTQEESIQWIKENMLNKEYQDDQSDNFSIHVTNIDIKLFDHIIIYAMRLIDGLEQQLFDKDNVQELFMKLVLASKGSFFSFFEIEFNNLLKEVEPFTKEKDNEDK